VAARPAAEARRPTTAPREGRDLFLEETLSGALSFGTVLSLPFLLDELVPRIAAAVDGDPDPGTA